MANIYNLVIYNEGNYYNNYTADPDTYHYALTEEDNSLKLWQYYDGFSPSDGNLLYTFTYSDGYEIELATVNFNESYPSDATYNVYYSSNNYNDINTMLIINQDTAINFIDVINDDPGDDPGDEDLYTLYLYQNDLSTPITSYGSDENISFYVSDHDIYDFNDTIVFSFTDGFYVEQYNDSTYEASYTNVVNFDLSALSYEDVQLVFHDVVNPGPEPGPSVNKTHVGNSTVALKKVGNATVVKEVLNGVTIYQA